MTTNREIRTEPEQARDAYGHFMPGVSGNPVGRPRGIKDRRRSARQDLLGPLLPKAVEKLSAAIEKDEKWAIDLVVEYCLPKPRPVDSDEMHDLEERLQDLEQAALRRTW